MTLENGRSAAELIGELKGYRADQVLLRNLIPTGWSIPTLCDILIDPALAEQVDSAVLLELTRMLEPAWVLSRRAELASLQLAAEVSGLRADLRALGERFFVPGGSQAPARASTPNPGAGVPPKFKAR